jgi:NitT/TauT family transport system substrate-binding protein
MNFRIAGFATCLAVGMSGLAGVLPAAAQEQTIRIGTVYSIATVNNYTAIEKGWFKQFGINVEIETLDTSANVISLLATNHLQMIEGGISAAYFNAIDQKMPIIIAGDRTSTPLNHKLLVRKDLEGTVKRIADLKGRIIGNNGTASVTTYELSKLLESDGVNPKDVEFKNLGFPLQGAAFQSKALDATLIIQPWGTSLVDDQTAFLLADPDDRVKVRPLTIAVTMINTDWAKKNDQLLRNFYIAYLRSVREYCVALHGGPNRKEMVERVTRTGPLKDVSFIEKYPWPARNMNGEVNMPSLMDMQDFFFESGFTKTKFAANQLVTKEYSDNANRVLGAFPEINKDSKISGCR